MKVKLKKIYKVLFAQISEDYYNYKFSNKKNEASTLILMQAKIKSLLERYEEETGIKNHPLYIEACVITHGGSPRRIRDCAGRVNREALPLKLGHSITLKYESPKELYKEAYSMSKEILGKDRAKKIKKKARNFEIFGC